MAPFEAKNEKMCAERGIAMNELYVRFPGGKGKAVTLSYDDGVEQDERLLEIMRENGLKGTFNLNSGLYAEEGTVFEPGKVHRRLTLKKAVELFGNTENEVAVHGLYHPFYTQIPVDALTYEIVKDRENLEKQFHTLVRGSAYPFGVTNPCVEEVLKNAGIVYARTTEATHRFDLPADWLKLNPTCHHKDPQLMELAEKFIQWNKGNNSHLFYLWGHSFEFEADNNWNIIEQFASYIGKREDVWYATNIEICDYIQDFYRLRFSLERNLVENPTASVIWFFCNGEIRSVEPGQRIQL